MLEKYNSEYLTRKNRVMIIAFSDSRGGAAIASRLHVMRMKELKSLSIEFIVAEKKINDQISKGPNSIEYGVHYLYRLLALFFSKMQYGKNKVKHSLNIFSSLFVLKSIKNTKCHVIHYHWINNETISISQIHGFLKNNPDKKFIFTLHDDWFFCGSEHYTDINCTKDRYINSYTSDNKNVSFLDVDRIIFNEKLKLKKLIERDNVIFTAPSNYLVDKARSSFLLRDCNITLIPNLIDTEMFKPKFSIKKSDFLIDDSFVILFGAIGGASYLKGSDLLLLALEKLSLKIGHKNISLITFGGCSNRNEELFGFKVVNLGHISDKEKLASLYTLADVTIVPSRLEAFGQVAAESLSCETPVIAFNNSGVSDIVQNNISGYLIDPFDTDKLSESILNMINLPKDIRVRMGKDGRDFIKKKFSSKIIEDMWLNLYK